MFPLFQWDGDFLLWVQEHLRADAWTPFMKTITVFGNAGVFWLILMALMFCMPKTRRAAFASGLAMLFVFLSCNLLVKNVVARTRPYEVIEGLERLIAPPVDYSFPSGHTAISFGAAVALLFYLDCRIGIGLLALAATIAWSRLYLGVHYPTDVLAGLAFGIVMGILGHLAADRLIEVAKARMERKEPSEAKQEAPTDEIERK
ncbi:MAG: phosphatase PAP2 family protein [Lachnospiraceae bacterium]|nr:phosphatase PAP2 family protein [Lachnospiraceae bacterium]